MWEKTRVDGTRKLRVNALPTLFSFSPPEAVKRKSHIKRAGSALKNTKSSLSKHLFYTVFRKYVVFEELYYIFHLKSIFISQELMNDTERGIIEEKVILGKKAPCYGSPISKSFVVLMHLNG